MLANVFDITSCFRLSPPWEGDVFSDFSGHHTNDFNPRPPWGGRLLPAPFFVDTASNFNPRPPWGGRRSPYTCHRRRHDFNPRPPWGGRQLIAFSPGDSTDFNPRPPWGGRQLPRIKSTVK